MTKKFHFARVTGVAGGHFVHDAFTSFLATLLPLVIEKLALSMTMAGMLSVIFRLPNLLNPVLGRLTDRIDLRLPFIAAPAISAGAMCLLGVAPGLLSLSVLLVISGLAAAVYHVVAPVTIAENSGDRVGRGMSFFMTAGEMARTAGPLCAAAAVTWLGFENLAPLSLLGVAYSVLLWFQFGRGAAKPKARQPEPLRGVFKRMRRLMTVLTLCIIARNFVAGTLFNYLTTYMVHDGHPLAVAGSSLALLELCGTASTFVGGPASDRWGRKTVLVLGFLLGPIGMLGFLYAPGWATLPCLAFTGLTIFATSPAMMATVHDHAGESRGSANGLFMMMMFVCGATQIVLVGALVDLFGFQSTLTFCALACFGGIPAALFLPSGRTV